DHPTVDNAVRDALLSQLQTTLANAAREGKVIKQNIEVANKIIAQVKDADKALEQVRKLEERTEAQFKVFKNLANSARVEVKTRQDLMQSLLAQEAEARLKGNPVPTSLRGLYDQVMPNFALRQNEDLKALRAERWIAVQLE